MVIPYCPSRFSKKKARLPWPWHQAMMQPATGSVMPLGGFNVDFNGDLMGFNGAEWDLVN